MQFLSTLTKHSCKHSLRELTRALPSLQRCPTDSQNNTLHQLYTSCTTLFPSTISTVVISSDMTEAMWLLNDHPVHCSACRSSKDEAEKNFRFETADSLWSHIAIAHAYWIPFACTLCPMFVPTDAMLKQHFDRAHPGELPKAIYTYEEEKKIQIKEIFLESQNLQIGGGNKKARKSVSKPPEAKKAKKPTETKPENAMDASSTSQADPHTTTPAVVDVVAGAISLSINLPIVDDIEGDDNEEQSSDAQKKRFACKLCTKVVAYNHKDTHVWNNHMTERRYRCTECGHVSLRSESMRKHAQEQHPLLTDSCWQDRKVELKSEYMATFQAAFGKYYQFYDRNTRQPSSSTTGVARAKSQMEGGKTDCRLCDKALPQKFSRTQHIWTDHMAAQRFSCNLCDQGYPFLRNIRSHARFFHDKTADDEISWTDNKMRLFEEHKAAYIAAFGTFYADRYSTTTSADQSSSSSAVFNEDDEEETEESNPLDKLEFGSRKQIRCNICRKNMHRNYRDKHVWFNHMRERRFRCKECPFEARLLQTMKKHVNIFHLSRTTSGVCWTDRKAEIQPEYIASYKASFGKFRERTSTTPKTKMESQCRLCSWVVPPGSNRGQHIWLRHMENNRFSCDLCGRGSPRLESIKKHAAIEHHMVDTVCWTDHRAALLDQFKATHIAAYGSYIPKSCDVQLSFVDNNASD